jgi:phosphoglycerate dehydrogenase-like enzyme
MSVDLRRLTVVNQVGRSVADVLARFPGQVEPIEGSRETAAPWEIGEADILITGPSPAWKAAPPEPPASWGRGPRLVQVVSAGVDGFPSWLLRDRIVTCGRGDAAVPIAEYVLTALLEHEKRFETLKPDSAADWTGKATIARQDRPLGTLEGRTLGLAGYGAIGRAVAERARAFGMEIVAWRRSGWSVEEKAGLETVASLGELASRSDHLVLALPLTEETRGCVNAETLARARPGLHLVNIARGALVDQSALLAALDEGRLAAATLDVTTPEPLPDGHPFYTHPRIRLTPHISWCGPGVAAAAARRIEENIARFVAGRPLLDIVDPERGY